MIVLHQSLSLSRRLRLWLATPLFRQLLLLAGAVLISWGYGQVWAPVGTVEEVTRQVVEGLLAVAAGAGLAGMWLYWRD